MGIDDVDGHLGGVEFDAEFFESFKEVDEGLRAGVAGEADISDFSGGFGFQHEVEDAVLNSAIDVAGTGEIVHLPEVEVIGFHPG